MVRVGAEIDPSFNSGLDSASGKLSDFGDKAGTAGAAWAQASGKIQDAIPDLHQIGEATDKATESLKGMVEGLIQLAEALVVTEALKEFGEEALSTYANVQKASISLGALTGSSEGAEKAIEALKGIALSDALSFPQLVQAYQRMTAFGFSADQIPGVLQAAANAAAATDKSFDSVANAIERMALSGSVGSKQLAALGISTADLGAALGVTAADAAAAFKALDASERVTVLSTALQKYADVAKAVAGSISGQWQNLKTQTEFVFESVGAALAPVASQLMGLLSNDVLPFLQGIADGFGRLPAPIKDVVVVLGFLGAAIPTASLALSGLQKLLGAFEVMNLTGWASSFAGAIPNIVTAIQNDLIPALTTGETVILRLGQAGIVAGAAFAGWQLGTWLYNNVPMMKQFGDAVGDLILKLPGLEAIINRMNGVGEAQDNLGRATQALNDKLQNLGKEVVRQAGESLDSFAARVRQAAKDTGSLTEALTPSQKALNDLAKAVAGVETVWGQQTMAVVQAKANLEAVTVAYKAGAATLGQYQAALDDVDKAQKTVNPNYVTAKEYQELLKKATTDLEQAQTALVSAFAKIAPQLLDVESAEAKVEQRRDELKVQTGLLVGAEAQLAAVRESGRGGAAGLQAAEDAEQAAKVRVEQSARKLTDAERELSEAKKEEKTVSDALAAAENDFANTLAALHLPTLKSYGEAMRDVEAKKRALVEADNAEQDAFIALNNLYKTGVNDATALKEAEANLEETRTAVKDATNGLKQSEKDLTDTQNALKVASTELAAGEQALAALYKDHLAGTRDLQSAVNDLADARRKEQTAADDLRSSEDALMTVQKSGTATDQDLKKATDDARMARENLKIATANAAAAEGTIQQQFGLSKTAADVLAGSTVSLTEVFKDMGLKSAASLQALADVSQKEYALIASSGTASANQLRDAQIKALQDQKAAYIANGTDLSAAQQATLDHLLNQQSAFNQAHEDQWHTLYLNIDGQIMGLSNKLVQDLFEGNGSFGKTALKALEDIGAAVVSAFIAPATKAIANFIAGSIADLMGKTGFGGLSTVITDCWGKMAKGISDSISGIGELDKTIATASGDLTKLGDGLSGGTPSTGTGGIGGTGGGGAAASAGSSLAGIITAIADVATAISSIIGNFQMAHMETSLNAIEHNTRYTMMYVGERADGGILGQMFNVSAMLTWGPIVKNLEAIKSDFKYYSDVSLGKLGAIGDQTFWAMKKLDDIDSRIGKGSTSSTDTAQLGALNWMQTALQNINNNLVAMVAQNEWIKTALQNINNGIVASAGWLQGISNMFSSGAAKVGGGSANPTVNLAADAFTGLANYVGSQFSTLYTWLGAALKPLLTLQGGQALTIAPVLPTTPTFASTGGSTASTTGTAPAAFDTTALQAGLKVLTDAANSGFASVVAAIKAIPTLDLSKLGSSVSVDPSKGVDVLGGLKSLGDALGLKLDRLAAILVADTGTPILSAQLARVMDGISRLTDLNSAALASVVAAIRVSDQITLTSIGQVVKGEAELFAQGIANLAGLSGIQARLGQLADITSTNFAALIAAIKTTISVPTPSLAFAGAGVAPQITSSSSSSSVTNNFNFHQPRITSTREATALLDTGIQELRRRGRTAG